MEALTVIDPKTFLSARSLEDVISIVQFGSSLHSKNPGDIDLCIVTKTGSFFDFLSNEPFVTVPENIDISLLREEELRNSHSFRFGSHGAHLLVSLREGEALYGENIFLKFPVPSMVAVKESILDRLYDYLYEVRKLETGEDRVELGLKKRWAKFQRLSIFLIDSEDNFNFPGILSISDAEVERHFEEYGLHYQREFTPIGFEHIWEMILAKNLQS